MISDGETKIELDLNKYLIEGTILEEKTVINFNFSGQIKLNQKADSISADIIKLNVNVI